MEWVPLFLLMFVRAHWRKGFGNVVGGAACLLVAFVGCYALQPVLCALFAAGYWCYLAYRVPVKPSGLSEHALDALSKLLPSKTTRVFCGACAAFLLAVCSDYFAQATVILAALSVALQAIRALRRASDARAPYRVIGIWCLAAILVSPLLIPLIRQLSHVAGGGAIAALSSVDLLSLWVPYPFSTLGRAFGWTTESFLTHRNTSAFLGYATVALAVYGFYRWRRGGAEFWALCGCCFVIVSLGPHLRVGDETVLPALWLPHEGIARFFPFLRFSSAPQRLMFGAYLSLAVLVGYAAEGLAGAARVRTSGSPAFWRTAVVAVVVLVVFVEHLGAPLPMATPRTSPFYRRIALPGDYTLIDTAFGANMFFQTIHGKKIFGGYHMRAPEKTRAFLARPSIASALLWDGPPPTDRAKEMRFLRRYKVRYIIDHGDKFVHVLRDFMRLPVVYRDKLVTVYLVRRTR